MDYCEMDLPYFALDYEEKNEEVEIIDLSK